MARHSFNTIIKFADNTAILGLITNNYETAYREEVRLKHNKLPKQQNNKLPCQNNKLP